MQKLEKYYTLLALANKDFNLMGYKTFQEALVNLFQDSLEAARLLDFSRISSLADVGTGAGFPGLIFSVLFPEKKVYLIEVNNKKVKFLRSTALELGLANVEVVDLDWRTFCRKTKLEVDLFFSKAALQEDEICRMFRSYSHYRNRQMVYFASMTWKCVPRSEEYVRNSLAYKLGGKERRLVFFGEGNEQK